MKNLFNTLMLALRAASPLFYVLFARVQVFALSATI
jgi:hypothetical protein